MKRLIAAILIACICTSLFACDSNNEDQIDFNVLEIKNVTINVPTYWTEEGSTNGCLSYYAEKDTSGLSEPKTVILKIEFAEESDTNYDVSFSGLEADNENMIKVLEEKYTDANILGTEVYESDNGVKGILYKFSLNHSTGLFTEKPAKGYCFCFASESDRRWYYITMIKVNDAKGETYEGDYMTMLASIACKNIGSSAPTQGSTTPVTETPPATTTPQATQPQPTTPVATEPISQYEKAFVRTMSNYSLYYMFDTDTNAVVYFGTNDTYVEKGTYTGDFSSGVTITWSHGQWTETFTHKANSTDATLVDGTGYDWAYKLCSVEDAQGILDSLT